MNLFSLAVAAATSISLAAAHHPHEQMILSSGGQDWTKPVNVAIIGAGAGGASTAYHLAKFGAAANVPFNITVFERNTYIGGRSTTVNAYDDEGVPVELGASIFVEVNSILNAAVAEFNLSTIDFIANHDIPGAALGIWNGQEFVITQDGRWWDNVKFFWRYGTAPLKAINLMKSVVGKFLSMYDEPHFPFESLTQVAQDVGLLAVTSATGEQYLAENGITGDFGNEVIQAATRVNYAQNLPFIHALEALVCLATENATSVKGGNWQMFEGMVVASNATALLETKVTAIEKHSNGSSTLTFRSVAKQRDNALESQLFDAVVVAAPYQYANLSLSPALAFTPDKIPYVELHVTLFTSSHLLSPAFFNMPSNKPVPRVILTTLPKSEEPRQGPSGVGTPGFFSISLLQPVANPRTGRGEYLYKIFSPMPPDSNFLSQLLGIQRPHHRGSHSQTNPSREDDQLSLDDISWIYRKVWHSYPYELPRVTFEKVRLDDGLWYTNGMESFISTMETSALMGMNVARLIVNEWRFGRGFPKGSMRRPSLSETGGLGDL